MEVVVVRLKFMYPASLHDTMESRIMNINTILCINV